MNNAPLRHHQRVPSPASHAAWPPAAPPSPAGSALLSGIVFFELALDEKVICVPGLFFDINPNKRRQVGGERPCLMTP